MAGQFAPIEDSCGSMEGRAPNMVRDPLGEGGDNIFRVGDPRGDEVVACTPLLRGYYNIQATAANGRNIPPCLDTRNVFKN